MGKIIFFRAHIKKFFRIFFINYSIKFWCHAKCKSKLTWNNGPYIFIPFRRNSKIEKLNHEENGFQDGRWKSDLTRWNQLRFTNEVMIGVHDNSKDGLSTCEFTLHGRLKTNNVISK